MTQITHQAKKAWLIMDFNLMSLLSTIGLAPKQDNKTAVAIMGEDVAMKNKIMTEVAKVLAAEGASEGEEGMRAIASTIMNRMAGTNKNALDIVSQKNQYYGYTAENKDKLYKQVKDTADKVARDLVEGKLKDNTGGAKYFLLPKEKVRSWHGDKTVNIGKHTFYKEAKRK